MRELYWDHPEIAAEHIAHAFGLRAGSEVFRAVGPDTRALPCRGGCGTPLIRRVESRTRLHADPRLCPACQQRADNEAADRQRRWAEQREQDREYDRQIRAQLDAAIAAGAKPAVTYVEYDGIPGTWRLDQD